MEPNLKAFDADQACKTVPVRPRKRRHRQWNGYRDGKFYVFSKDGVLVARLWPEPLAWQKKAGASVWQACRPFMRVDSCTLEFSKPEHPPRLSDWHPAFRPLETRDAGLASMIASGSANSATLDRRTLSTLRAAERARAAFLLIPGDIRSLVARFPYRQWHLLSMLDRCENSMDLVLSNPALAWALASCPVFHRVTRPMDAIRRLAGKRRRQIAGWLGFPETDSAVRILRKIPPAACGIGPLLSLRQALQGSPLRLRLEHLPTLAAPVLLTAADRIYGPRVTNSFLHELAGRVLAGRAGPAVRLLTEARFHCFGPNPKTMPGRIPDLKTLADWHESQQEFPVNDEAAGTIHRRFPDPPIPGCFGIHPILSPRKLLREGKQQRNCVGDYISEVGSGNLFVYCIDWPQRATLAITKDRDGIWQIEEIAGFQNRKVSAAARKHVVAWLEEQSGPDDSAGAG